MEDKEFIKLSHFDRIRRGYFDKIPLNFMLIGFTITLNVFSLGDSHFFLICVIGMFGLGFYLKEKIIDKDNIELKQKSKEIESAFQKRVQSKKQESGKL